MVKIDDDDDNDDKIGDTEYILSYPERANMTSAIPKCRIKRNSHDA